jgi:ribosome biogenesis protein Nip4
MDAEEETRRAKLAQSDLNLIQEFLDEERSRLFDIFITPHRGEDLQAVQYHARALTSLEDFLLDLVNTGKLAAKKEFQYD